ncbi:MAG TPA: alpha/beta hydrolase, partial [Candidatus Saccharimonadales bacterium]|nr:alpha/beta hydrolase [Candidatus Saccharimonadales bacterium]
VIASISGLRPDRPVILVGHSMGCLVAVRIARLRPDLVRHLVLYEMPLYEGLPEKRSYRARLAIYNRLYARLLRFEPTFEPEKARLVERLARRITGFEVERATWQPFLKSLENTILKQTAAEDIKHIAAPMDVIYGSFDMLVIRGEPKRIFGEGSTNITAHTIRARHMISTKASRFIVSRIKAALDG